MFGLERFNKIFHTFRQPVQRDVTAFISWARGHAVTFDPLDGLNADIEKLSFLDGILENKRVVYLGEEDHWIHEKTDYRLVLLRYLVSRGWRYIGEELGLSDGVRIDRYLETGKEAYLERIATYGYKGALRTDRDDKATGILKDFGGNYPVTEFKSEQLRLTRALRDISLKCGKASGRLRFFGFDLDAAAGGGYEDVEELLSPLESEPAVMNIRALIRRVPDETLDNEICRLRKVAGMIEAMEADLGKLLGEKRFGMLRQWVQTLYDSLAYNRITNTATDYKTLNIAMAAREEAMYRHVKAVLARMGPQDKLVLMGHNRHLSKDIGLIGNAGAVPPGGKRVPSVGTSINRLLPGQVFSVWELHDRGSSSQPVAGLRGKYTSVPGSLNAILAEAGSNYILPTAGAPLLEKTMDIAGLYNAVFRTAIALQADAVFFIREVSPLRGT